jgi:hypothetical protein
MSEIAMDKMFMQFDQTLHANDKLVPASTKPAFMETLLA